MIYKFQRLVEMTMQKSLSMLTKEYTIRDTKLEFSVVMKHRVCFEFYIFYSATVKRLRASLRRDVISRQSKQDIVQNIKKLIEQFLEEDVHVKLKYITIHSNVRDALGGRLALMISLQQLEDTPKRKLRRYSMISNKISKEIV